MVKVAGLSKAKIQLSRPGSAKEPQARTVSNRVHRSVVLKGTVSRDRYFSTYCMCADCFQGLSMLLSVLSTDPVKIYFFAIWFFEISY